MDAVRDGVQSLWFEDGDMKDGVDRSEGVRESKGEGIGASLSDDVIGTKIFFREFVQGTSGLEMFSFDEDFIANFGIQCKRLALIGGDLISFLSITDC